jgi:hypothetical protein
MSEKKPLTREAAIRVVVEAVEYAAFHKGAFVGANPERVAQVQDALELLKHPESPLGQAAPCADAAVKG